jgi:ligand-binding sensor domain-containing protein
MKQPGALLFKLTLSIFPIIAFAQFNSSYNFAFKTYTSKDGLVHNYTKKCLADSKGFLWIITQHGLSRFDGFAFKNFEHSFSDTASLPENDLEDIAIDNKDNIWLSYGKGLCFYNQNNNRFIKIFNNKKTLESNRVVYDAKRNCLWSVSYKSFASVNCQSFIVQSYTYSTPPKFNYGVGKILLDSKDRLWVPLLRHGYRTINLTTGLQYYYDEDIWPTSVYEDNEKNIWLTTWQDGFRKIEANDTLHHHLLFGDPYLNATQNKFDFISYATAQSNIISGSSILWVATLTNGILLFNKKNQTFIRQFRYEPSDKNGVPTDFVENIYADKSGVLWICTWHGISKINQQEQQFISAELPYLKTYFYNCLTGIADDPTEHDIAWMAVNGSGMVKFDKAKNKMVSRYFYADDDIDNTGIDKNFLWRWPCELFADSSRNIWAATYGGLIKISHGKADTLPIKNTRGQYAYANKIIELPKGVLWVASGLGLCKVNGGNNHYQIFEYDKQKTSLENGFFDICRYDDNHLIVSSDAGIKLFNISNQTFTKLNYQLPQSDSNAQLICRNIQLIGNTLYAGTFAGLIAIDMYTKKSTFIGKQQGIDKIDLRRLQQDAGHNLWIFTSDGLFKYDTQKKLFEKYTTSDGIYDVSEDLIGFFTYNNRLHIGYRMAVTSFKPLQVNVNTQKLNPVITDVFIKGTRLNSSIDSLSKTNLLLTHYENEITFVYTAPAYTNSNKINFAYQFTGYDTNWQQAGSRRTVTYNNLKPGYYIFKLKVSNSSGLLNDKAVILKLYIRPAFWQRWWFWPLIALFFVLFVFWFAKKRIAAVRLKEAQKTAVNKLLAELETKMLRSQMNPHFIFNSLNSIQRYIWENKEEDAAEYLALFAKLIRAILENSGKEYVTIKEEIEVMKWYVELEHRRSNAGFEYQILVDEIIDQAGTLIPPLLMQPFIENAIWHGLNEKDSNGNLKIMVMQKGLQIICMIDDDGVGRQPKNNGSVQNKKSMGIDITRQRISRLMQTTRQTASVLIHDKIENNIAAGTTVTITLPLQKI